MLTDEQTEDLRQLQTIAELFSADLVMIGAAALLCFIDLGRFTRDIDLVIALDLAELCAFSSELKKQGWTQERGREHRWRAPKRSIVDLLPAGPKLRATKQIVWPESQFAMSLVGFEHVFTRSVPVTFSSGVQLKVIPPPVIALLKIIAYTDDQQRRHKDLLDLKSLLLRYEALSDRIFSDEVFAAELDDIEYASAFLLGSDIGVIARNEEIGVVQDFLSRHRMASDELLELAGADLRFQMQIRAFEKGFRAAAE
jgi:predicted nucleotidyltransferase